MKIAVDGNLLCGKKTGMGMVVHHVLMNWRSSDDRKIILYVPEPLESAYNEKLIHNGIEIKVLGKNNYFKWEQIILPSAVKKDGADILWCPYNTAPLFVSCKTLVTVHDLIYMKTTLRSTKTLYKKLGVIYRKTIVPMAIKKASVIFTDSEFSSKEISSRFYESKNKLQIVYVGADYSGCKLNHNESKMFFEKNNIRKPYILGFASLEKRKNTMRLIEAYRNLSDELLQKYQLVLFGFRGYEYSEELKYIQNNNIRNIIILGYVSDKEKNTLYSESSLFVFPSLYEGFGIPVLEAFANETPVVTSNTTSLPEVAGDAAIMVDPLDADSINSGMVKVLCDTQMSKELIEKGKHQLQKFDWKKTSEQIYSVLLEIADS